MTEIEILTKALELCVIDNCSLCTRVYCYECPIDEKCLESLKFSSDTEYYITRAKEELTRGEQ